MKYRMFVSDPVLRRTDFRCGYCGKDLLADLDAFLGLVRDHLTPRSAGGPDGHQNRVAACSVCDRLKADTLVTDLDEARAVVADQRRNRAVWFQRIRQAVRGEPAAG